MRASSRLLLAGVAAGALVATSLDLLRDEPAQGRTPTGDGLARQRPQASHTEASFTTAPRDGTDPANDPSLSAPNLDSDVTDVPSAQKVFPESHRSPTSKSRAAVTSPIVSSATSSTYLLESSVTPTRDTTDRTLLVHVFSRDNGLAVANAMLSVTPGNVLHITDSHGNAIARTMSAWNRIDIDALGFMRSPPFVVEVDSGALLSLDIALDRDGWVEGTVSGLGCDPTGAVVEAYWHGAEGPITSTIDATGQFVLGPLSVRHADIHIYNSGRVLLARELITVVPGTTSIASIRCGRLGWVTVMVSGYRLSPSNVLARWLVQVLDGKVEIARTSISHGRVRLQVPEGIYAIRLMSRQPLGLFGSSEIVTVHGSQNTDVILQLPRGGVPIEGVVLDADGRPASSVAIGIGVGGEVVRTYSDVNGRFQYLVSGDMPIEMRAYRNGQTAVMSLAPGTSTVVLPLLRAASLIVRVASKAQPEQNVVLAFNSLVFNDLIAETRILQGILGRDFKLSDLPAGDAELLIRLADGREQRKKVDLPPGRGERVHFEFD